MTKEDIIYNNTLIAKFLGGTVEEIWKIQNKSEFAWKGEIAKEWRHNKLGIKIGEAIICSQLMFNESWD